MACSTPGRASRRCAKIALLHYALPGLLLLDRLPRPWTPERWMVAFPQSAPFNLTARVTALPFSRLTRPEECPDVRRRCPAEARRAWRRLPSAPPRSG